MLHWNQMNVNGQIVTLYPLSIFSLDTDNLILNQNESNLIAFSLSNLESRNILLSSLILGIGLRKTFFLEESKATRHGPGGPRHAPEKVCSYLVVLRGRILPTDKIIKGHYSSRKRKKVTKPMVNANKYNIPITKTII